jgi:hypothetical protein
MIRLEEQEAKLVAGWIVITFDKYKYIICQARKYQTYRRIASIALINLL